MKAPIPANAPAAETRREKIVAEFTALVTEHAATGPFLEIGHGPPQNAILLDEAFQDQERHVVVRYTALTLPGVTFHHVPTSQVAHALGVESMGTVIWHEALAHDKSPLKTLEAIKSVLRPGGAILVCTPGFTPMKRFGMRVVGGGGQEVPSLVPTRTIAKGGGADYWRLSPEAMRSIILEGFDVKDVHIALVATLVFGVGVKPHNAETASAS